MAIIDEIPHGWVMFSGDISHVLKLIPQCSTISSHGAVGGFNFDMFEHL